MIHTLYIFILALTVRLINLYFNQIDSTNSYLLEDQLMYWDWSLKNAYTAKSSIDPNLLLERMPGSFIFFQFAIWVVGENLFGVLVMQTIIDSITCVIIAFIAKSLNKKLFFLAGVVASFSPLLIIVSSQILSDTLFLFFLSISILFILTFIKQKKESLIYLGALFLSLALFTRVVVLPLIFIIPIYILYFCYKERYYVLKVIRIISIFIIISFTFSFPRMISNYFNFNTISLTSQSGSHFAYWVLPAVLDFDSSDKKDLYKANIQDLNKTLEEKNNPFERSSLLKKEALNFLLSTEKKIIFLAWSKGAILNILGPPFIIDHRFRSFPHPSFYENDRNLLRWLSIIFSKDKFKSYKFLLCVSIIFSLLFIFLSLYGFILIYKNYFQDSIILLIISVYFIAVTGPVFSPKYIHPIMPLLIILEVVAIRRVFEFFLKNIINKKSN